jgi:hypothetical protein
VLNGTGDKGQTAFGLSLRAHFQYLIDTNIRCLNFSNENLTGLFFVILVLVVFYINDFQVIFVSLLNNVWAKVEPTQRILIGLHEDEFVSFDNDVKLVTDAL